VPGVECQPFVYGCGEPGRAGALALLHGHQLVLPESYRSRRWRRAREQAVTEGSQPVNVRPRPLPTTGEVLLRRGVAIAHSARPACLANGHVDPPGRAEIDQYRQTVGWQHDVGRLYVPVHDASSVDRGQYFRETVEQLSHFGRGDPVTGGPCLEIDTGYEVHGEPAQVSRSAARPKADDAGMFKTRKGSRFRFDFALAAELHDDRTAACGIVGKKMRALLAPRQRPKVAEALGQFGPCRCRGLRRAGHARVGERVASPALHRSTVAEGNV
jgi:hypothetical protein